MGREFGPLEGYCGCVTVTWYECGPVATAAAPASLYSSVRRSLSGLEDGRDPLSDADAHRRKAVSGPAPAHLVD